MADVKEIEGFVTEVRELTNDADRQTRLRSCMGLTNKEVEELGIAIYEWARSYNYYVDFEGFKAFASMAEKLGMSGELGDTGQDL